jgi:hypothetical protein
MKKHFYTNGFLLICKITFIMESIIFWDVTPCSLLSCNRRFGGTYRLHSACHLLPFWFFLKLFLGPRRWRRYVPPKLQLQLNRLHGVTSQKVILLITTAVKTSNPITFIILVAHLAVSCGPPFENHWSRSSAVGLYSGGPRF